MPPLPPVANVIKITSHFTIGTDTAALVRQFFGYTGGAPSNADCSTIATGVNSAAAANFPAVMNADVEYTACDVLDLSSSSGGNAFIAAAAPGSRGGNPLAAGTAFLVNFGLSRRYRGGKPRNYWPFLDSGDLNGPSQWLSASVTAAGAALNAYWAAVEAITAGTTVMGGLRNVSYYEGFTAVTNPITGRTKDVAKLRTGGPVVDVLTSTHFNGIPASQRRRNLH